MHITKALLIQFIENKCSKEESEWIYQYLLKYPQALEELLGEEEWEHFEWQDRLQPAVSEAWWTNIQQQRQPKVLSINWKRWWQVAAAVAIVAGTIVFFTTRHHTAPTVAAINKRSATSVNAIAGTQKQFINTGSRPLVATLSDGSFITLYGHSILECTQPFDADKRNLSLHGEALFKVAKDKARPFTVFTDNFSTTALGTVFRVNAYSNKAVSSIKLLSGRVVVRNLQAVAEPVYLEPGDECSFNTSDNRLQLHAGSSLPLVLQTIHAGVPVTENEDVVIFANAPLQQVCDRLSAIYHIAIQINIQHPEQRKFTGTLQKHEPVEELLTTIAELNNIKVIKQNTGYVLSE